MFQYSAQFRSEILCVMLWCQVKPDWLNNVMTVQHVCHLKTGKPNYFEISCIHSLHAALFSSHTCSTFWQAFDWLFEIKLFFNTQSNLWWISMLCHNIHISPLEKFAPKTTLLPSRIINGFTKPIHPLLSSQYNNLNLWRILKFENRVEYPSWACVVSGNFFALSSVKNVLLLFL